MDIKRFCTHGRLWASILLAAGLLASLLIVLTGPPPFASQAAAPAKAPAHSRGALAEDLEISQSGPERTFPGEVVTYTLLLINQGVTAMDNISVTDTWRTDILGKTEADFDALWPYGPLMTFGGYQASNPALVTAFTHTLNRTLQRGEATWSISSLPAGGSLEIVFTATTPIILQPALANYPYGSLPSKFQVMGPSTLQNTVSALVGATEYPAAFSTATVVGPLLNITLEAEGETTDKGEGRVGRLITYTLAVENMSSQTRVDAWPASNLVVSVTLPYQLNDAVLDILSSEAGVTPNYTSGSSFIQWVFPPTFVLTPGVTTQLTFTARIPASLDYNGDENKLQIAKFEGVTAHADLMPLRYASIKANSSVRVLSPFEKTGVGPSGKASTLVNEPVTYTLTFYNPVGVDTSLVLTDLLYSTFVFSQVVSGSPELLNVTEASDNIVVWRDVSLAPYAVVSVTFVTTPTYATLLGLNCNKSLAVTNGVSATSPMFPVGYVGHDDNKLAKITVQPQIKIGKTVLPTRQFPGETVTYTIALENLGVSHLMIRGTVTDTLYERFRFMTMTAGSLISYPQVLSDTVIVWTETPTIPAKTKLNIPFLVEVDGYFPESYSNQVEVNIPGIVACTYKGAAVIMLSPLFVNKWTELTEPVVQGDTFTYTVNALNVSPRTAYTVTGFWDAFDTEENGLVTPDTLVSNYYYTPTPSAYLTPGIGSWIHSFPVLFQGYGISAIAENGEWCDTTFANKIWASLRQDRGQFRYRFTGTSWSGNASPDGEFTAMPHFSLYQQVYPNPVAIGELVTFALTLRDNRTNPITPAQNVLLRWEVPGGFEFISSSLTPITQTATELAWNVSEVPFDTDQRVIFTLRAPYHRDSGWKQNFSPRAQVIDLADTSLCIPQTTKFVYSAGGGSEVPPDGIPGPIPEEITEIAFASAFQVNQGLEINKKPTPTETGPYGTVEYKISVKNLTGAPVASVVITDILPTYYGSYPWTYLEMVDGPAPDSESPLVWRLSSLPPKSTTDLVFTARANNWLGIALNEITGTASINLVTEKNYDTNRSVLVSSGIGFFKETAPESIFAGDLVTYTITLFNGEAYKLGNIVITDTLPPGFTFDSMIEPAGLSPQGNTTLVWHILSTLNSGSPYVIRFRARANSTAQGMFTGVYYNEISASAWNDQNQKPVLIPPSGPTAPVHVTGRPTVVIHKTASVKSILPAQDFLYTIGLYNEATAAVTLQVTDTLPVYFTLAEALTPTQATTITLGNQELVRWQNLTIAPQSWFTLTFRARVAADAEPGHYYNQVQVQIDEFLTPAILKLARVEVLIPRQVDAQVSSTNGTQVVRPAPDVITYTIHYTNAAASEVAFTGITLTVAFSPAAYISVLPGWGWTQSGEQYTQVIAGPLAPGQSGVVELPVQLENLPPEVWSLYYRVTMAYATAEIAQDTAPENNYDEDLDLISAGESMRLLKATAAPSVRATEEVTYILTLFNNHPTLSYTLRLSDTLPGFFLWDGVVAPTPAPVLQEDGRTVVWENLIIQPEALQQLSYRARVDLLAPGAADYCNVVQMQAALPGESAQAPVTAQSCVTVIPAERIDVLVTKSNGQDIVQPGETVTYTLIYENSAVSSAPLTTIILTETVSPYADVQQARWINTPGAQTNLGEGRYRIEIPVELQPGDVGAASFAVTLNSAVPTTTVALNNKVEVGYRTAHASIEMTTTNNTALDVDPLRQPDQEILATKAAFPDVLTAGEEFEYRITLHNPGGGVQMLNVLDTLPPGVVFVSPIDPTQNITTTWVGNRQQVIWQEILIQDYEMELSFRVRVLRSSTGGWLCNTVQIQRRVGGIFVPQAEVPNLACVNVTPLPMVDIQVSKDDGILWTEAGDTLIYTLHYTNPAYSQQTFTALTLTDHISPTALVAEVIGAAWTPLGDGVYHYVPPEPLAPGTSGQVDFVVRLSPTIPDITMLANSVAITYATAVPVFEQDTANDTDTDIDIIIPQDAGEVTLLKTVTPEATAPGGVVAYTIQLFNTAETAHTVRVTDTLPVSFTLASGAPDATAMSGERQQLIWHSVNLPAKGQAQLAFTARVAAAAPAGMYDNYVQARPAGGAVVEYEGARVTVSTLVMPAVDVQVTQSDGVTRFGAGDRLTYTVHYASAATSEVTLTQVTLTETIAPAANVTLVNLADWTALGGGRYTRMIGALAPGASGAVPFIVQVSGEPPAITNTVEIGYPAQGVQETSSANNRAPDVNTLKGLTPTAPTVYLPLIMRQ